MKKVLTFAILLIMCLASLSVFAHQGKTDGNGGHRDNKNKSGLGSYHFHCGGYPAHLHENGVCPYSGEYSSGSKTSSSTKSTNTTLDELDRKYGVNGYEKATPAPTVKPKQSATQKEQSNNGWLWLGIPSAVGAGWVGHKVFQKKD